MRVIKSQNVIINSCIAYYTLFVETINNSKKRRLTEEVYAPHSILTSHFSTGVKVSVLPILCSFTLLKTNYQLI